MLNKKGCIVMLNAKTLSLLMLSFGSMSNKKLQKICYYVYSWYLAIYGKKIADIQFEAWVHGPVSKEIYNLYKKYGWNDIPYYEGFLAVDEEIIDFAEGIWGFYGKYSADELEEISHNELPWTKARIGYSKYESSDRVLKDSDIYNYYKEKYLEYGHITC